MGQCQVGHTRVSVTILLHLLQILRAGFSETFWLDTLCGSSAVLPINPI